MPVDSQNVQKHLSKISRINLLLAVVALLGVIFVYAWFRWGMDSSDTATATNGNANTNSAASTHANGNTNVAVASPEDVRKLTKEYQESVNRILNGYRFDDSTRAQELSNQIMILRAPAELRPMHVQLVVALQEVQQGKYDEANQRITQLKAQYSWFIQ